jgi:hypothetical protein
MKKLLIGISIIGMFSLTACTDAPSSDQKQRSQQETILQQATDSVGMPNITHFTERKNMKMILEKRDDPKLITYTYAYNEMTGKFIYIGRSIGYPIPYSTQYTNPQKPLYSGQSGVATIPQADPNSLFSPASADGTWVMLINEETQKADVFYSEPHLVTYPSKLPKRLCDVSSLPNDY